MHSLDVHSVGFHIIYLKAQFFSSKGHRSLLKYCSLFEGILKIILCICRVGIGVEMLLVWFWDGHGIMRYEAKHSSWYSANSYQLAEWILDWLAPII